MRNVNTLLQNLLNKFYPKVLYLFKYGSNYEEVTGGFEALPYYHAGLTSGGGAPVLSISSDGMSITPTPNKYGSVWSKKKIDVTNYTELRFKFSRTETTNSGGSLSFVSVKEQGFDANYQHSLWETASGEYVLDVSNVIGEYYFCIDVNITNKSDTLLFDFIELK